MSLNIFIRKKDIPRNMEVIEYNDAYFLSKKGVYVYDTKVNSMIKIIDDSTVISNSTILTRYGEYRDMSYLSTGCKIALNVYNNRDKVVSCEEAGRNALTEIFGLKNGYIYSNRFCSCLADFPIDINLWYGEKSRNFTSLQELCLTWEKLVRGYECGKIDKKEIGF